VTDSHEHNPRALQMSNPRAQAQIDAETLMIFACEQGMTRDRLLAALCEMVLIRTRRRQA